jgi:glucosamine--fructose-6-phosphate aminotransferase (isomerizing)
MVFLEDGEYATLTDDGRCDISSGSVRVEKTIEEVAWMGAEVQKNGHAHFMLKEMLEQPETIESTLRGRIDLENGRAVLGGLRDVAKQLKDIDRLIIVGCGSAYYAGMVGQYMIEEQVRLPVQIELASEFRYRASVIPPKTAVLAISQSGETADTLAAIREAKRCGALTLGIVNVVGSAIARETDAGVYTHAGPEIGVASTKAFLSQMTVLALLTAFLGRERETMIQEAVNIWLRELSLLPSSIRTILDNREHIEREAQKYANAPGMFYIGRKYQTPIAHEGALKLKEISYIHAEGYAAGEMKHGPIALADASFPCLALCPKDSVYEKTLSNMQELQARGAPLIAITTEDADVAHLAQTVITVPKTIEPLMPLLTVIPVQLFAYAVAVSKGIDPDKPRNLAKSVTVE